MPPYKKTDMNLPPVGLLTWILKTQFLKEDIKVIDLASVIVLVSQTLV